MALLSKINEINIDLYFTKQEKKIGRNVTVLGPNEINSGVTSWGPTTKVAIFREEEINKLIIHELIHYCHLDFRNVDFPYIDSYNINPNTEIRLNESYTEVMANLINCICCSYEYQNRENKELYTLFLNYEIKYSIYQCAKILKIYGFKNYEEFNRPYDGQNKFKQQTSVFSYFLVKTALLANLDQFSQFLNTYLEPNKMNTMNLTITNVPKAKESYVNLVHQCLQESSFKNLVNNTIQQISKTKAKISPKIKNTLRMTCIES
jgi:hypothetical protein